MRTHIKEMKDKIVPVLKRHDVARAAIFSSFVKGEMRKDSDMDLLVEFVGRKSLLGLAGLKMEFFVSKR